MQRDIRLAAELFARDHDRRIRHAERFGWMLAEDERAGGVAAGWAAFALLAAIVLVTS